jgi:hypothetical protein
MQSIPVRIYEAVACNGGQVSGSPTYDKIAGGNPRFPFLWLARRSDGTDAWKLGLFRFWTGL